jgi:hypothetical protein
MQKLPSGDLFSQGQPREDNVERMCKLLLAGLIVCMLAGTTAHALSNELPVGKYLEDPEHKDAVISFYVKAVYLGVKWANIASGARGARLYCPPDDFGDDDIFLLLDSHIATRKAAKRLKESDAVEMLLVDALTEFFTCPK